MLLENWITDYTLDPEYKQYIALAYIRKTENHLLQNRLHPYLPELQKHLQNMYKLAAERKKMQEAVNRELKEIDWENKCLKYHIKEENEKLWQPIDSIIRFSIPLFENAISKGKEVEKEISQYLSFYTLGIIPLYKKEGILLLSDLQSKIAYAFLYFNGLYNALGSKWINTQTRFIAFKKLTIAHTIHSFKMELMKSFRQIPAPATFVLESKKKIPIKETLLPIAIEKLTSELE